MKNITVKHTNKAFKYDPPDCGGSGWVLDHGLADQGEYPNSYSWCSAAGSFEPTVTFNFTGVAVYYSSTFLEGQLLEVVLDGISQGSVNLENPDGPKSDTSRSFVWWKKGLLDTEHTVLLRPNGSPRLAVDTFIYTIYDESDDLDIRLLELVPRAAELLPRAAQIATSADTSLLPTILGSIFGGLAFIIFIAIAVFLRKKAKERDAPYTWKVPVPPLKRIDDTPPPDITGNIGTSTTKFSQDRSLSRAGDLESGIDVPPRVSTNRAPSRTVSEEYAFQPDSASSVRPLPQAPRTTQQSPHEHYDEPSLRSLPAYHASSPTDSRLNYPPSSARTAPPPTSYASPPNRTYSQPFSVKLEPNRRRPST
ncbi:hypothetical protein FA15DRAFT_667428 [Coprinopsis marcescibilis]|uniref:Uncharacterized protein n=1 Tax=Coprinopsis marcescibilis TaxID=230819 RepID=A0A5C3L1V9_COPMA|nr:hypothetical protein FA15DRAFT_667428 [Coprinopsis marcescibilis]